jgi:hypothetical protein
MFNFYSAFMAEEVEADSQEHTKMWSPGFNQSPALRQWLDRHLKSEINLLIDGAREVFPFVWVQILGGSRSKSY